VSVHCIELQSCFVDIPLDVGLAVVKWVYTDQSEAIHSADDSFVLSLLTIAKKYKLDPLAARSVYYIFLLLENFQEMSEQFMTEGWHLTCLLYILNLFLLIFPNFIVSIYKLY